VRFAARLAELQPLVPRGGQVQEAVTAGAFKPQVCLQRPGLAEAMQGQLPDL
jgi:hypothetical protein